MDTVLFIAQGVLLWSLATAGYICGLFLVAGWDRLIEWRDDRRRARQEGGKRDEKASR